jgi:hypothetical protein
MTYRLVALACAALVAAPAAVMAQSDEDEAWLAGQEGAAGPASGEAVEAEAGEGGEGSADDAWLEGKEVKEVEAPVEDTTYTLREERDRWYFGIGGRFRYLAVPGGEIEWFPVEMAPTVQGYQIGIEGVFRHDGLSIVPFIQFGNVIGKGPFQEDGDPIQDVEWWDINLKLLMIGVEFFGSVTIRDWVYYYYGAGISFMFRLGDNDMVRDEAYRDTVDNKWHPCDGPCVTGTCPGGDPGFCEVSGGHYDQNWEGWKADPFYPYVAIIPLGFRFKPIPNLYANFEAGIALPLIPLIGIRTGYLF